jgi:hypothetical protein
VKAWRYILFCGGATAAVVFLVPSRLLALPSVHAEVQMSNVTWNPAAGTLMWLTNWELTATALAFDSVNGFAGEAMSDFGDVLPVTLTANAAGGYSSAFAQVAVDGTGDVPSLQTSFDLTFPPGDPFVTAFTAASAYREFSLTGVTGPVNVAFSFDYAAHLQGNAPGYGADFRALLSISDPMDVEIFKIAFDPMDELFSGTRIETLTLESGRPYSITLSVDNDRRVADSGPGLVLSAVLLLSGLAARRLDRSAVRQH